MATEVVAARARIIRRPRLTSMLDESTARIRLLIAPAGYGKTTLAREWLGEPERRDVWYRGGPASADVAALAAGIAESVSALIPDAGKRMRERLRATGHPEEDVEILAELLAEDVQEWPADAWLAFDDYQFAMESVASERFVEFLTQHTPIRMLITSRRRPGWATARRILYGELHEIDRRSLAMEEVEARAVLGRDGRAIRELIARAKGWPAVIGLAALRDKFELPSDDLPATLHTYFAQEVLQSADPTTRREFCLLAIAPVISHQLIGVVWGEGASQRIIKKAVQFGVLTEHDGEAFVMHPLLRAFLQGQLEVGSSHLEYATRLGEYFLAQGQWDHAFEVARRASLSALAEETIELGLDSMLRQGRIATIQRWVDFALSEHLDSPAVDLAEAELAFRQGEHEKAMVLASQAAVRFAEKRELRTRAHVRAGHSALLASKEREGLDHFRSAKALAQTWEQRREALVGLYFAASELNESDTAEALDELEAAEDHSTDGVLRLEVLRLTRATRSGGISEALESALPKLHLVERATDPLGLTAFLHMLSTALNLGARYREALDLVERQRIVAERYRLDLPVVHVMLNRAISQLGLRNFPRSADALDDVRRLLPQSGDPYLEATIRAINCRRLLASQRFSEAIASTMDEGEKISSPPLLAEYLSSRAMALACSGQSAAAEQALDAANRAYPISAEGLVFAPCVKAVIGLNDGGSPEVELARGWSTARDTGNFDSFVCSYRADHRLLGIFPSDARSQTELGELLGRSHDDALAARFGLVSKKERSARVEPLTTRESEVLRELEQGSTNREIANRLFISEATVKVHLRHIYEKLNVRNRNELLARRARRP